MTEAPLADTLAVCVNQQINRAQPCSTAGRRDHLRGPRRHHTARRTRRLWGHRMPGTMPLRDGCRSVRSGPGNA